MSVPDTGDPRVSSTVYVTIVGTILLLAVVIFAQWLYLDTQNYEDEQKLVVPTAPALVKLQTEQLGNISSYRYLNQAAGVVAIPVEQAIPLVIEELKKPQSLPKITTTQPAPARMETQPSQ
jgi:hypothetical protein